MAAARMPILVSLGGKDECPGSFATVKFSVIEPFSVTAILDNDKLINLLTTTTTKKTNAIPNTHAQTVDKNNYSA